MEAVVIRTAQPDDHRELAEIFRLASLSNDGDREALLANPQHLVLGDEAIVERRLRLAEVDERIGGFATIRPDGEVAELEDLFVHPDLMRRGVATKLIGDAIEQARRAGATRIEVSANGHALAFYRSVGFVAEGEVETELAPGIRMSLPVPPA